MRRTRTDYATFLAISQSVIALVRPILAAPGLRRLKSSWPDYNPVVVSAALALGIALAILIFWLPLPAGAQGPVGVAFTYQGRLLRGGQYVTDETCAFTFKLYDAPGTGSPPSGGTQLGSTLTLSATVTNGYFTADLNFGSGIFTGAKRYLEIAVQCPDDAGSTTMGQRVELLATPYAIYALNAANATTATTVSSVAWTSVTAKPTGFADNKDNDLLTEVCATNPAPPAGRVPKWDGAGGWLCGTDADQDTLRDLDCESNDLPKWNGTTWVCASDSNYTYLAGTGLSLSGVTFSISPTFRLPQGCANDQLARWNGSTWECLASYSAGIGLDLAGSQFSIDEAYRLPACGDQQLARSNGSTWVCSADLPYTAGDGIEIDVTNRTIGIADNGVTTEKIAADAVTMAKVNIPMGYGATSGTALQTGGDRDMYIYPVDARFTPDANGDCLVIATATIASTGNGNDGSNPYLRTAKRQGSSGDGTNDGGTEMRFGDVSNGNPDSASATYVWSVNSGDGETYFGCYIRDTSGNWDSDESVNCRVSFICQSHDRN